MGKAATRHAESGRLLHVASPLMTGPDVKALQKLLNAGGYGKGLDEDGEYGPMTAQAVYRAKFWLGFPRPDQLAGGKLNDYLTGGVKRTADMRALASRRKQAAKDSRFRTQAVALAKSKIGTVETPVNIQEFGRWYGMNGVPWCAIFVTWCFVNGGSKSFARRSRWAYVPYVLNDAHAARNGLTVTKAPEAGDLVLFDWDSDGLCDHIGIVEKPSPLSTIEGNTSPTDNSNGGQVMRRTDRAASDIAAFVHVSA
jgi:peptidoglycan hydrolase-like protein with peptidoglycan-binding domain